MKIPDQPAWGSSGDKWHLGYGDTVLYVKGEDLWVILERDPRDKGGKLGA